MRFHGADGGESPARSAGTLVFNWGDNAEVAPFIAAGDGCFEFLLDFELGVGGRALLRFHESFFLELFKGHICEVIDSLGPGMFSHVVVADGEESFCEDLEPVI